MFVSCAISNGKVPPGWSTGKHDMETLKIGGFELKRREHLDEIPGEGMVFEHTATGARLFALRCADENKSFCVGFRTPPENDSGLPHILEHSVLCGSRKFPLKEPFAELMRGSLNTFLNAMTYPDRTVYPVTSCNEKDLANLIEVYLDAVFFPKLSPECFLQEGWHYEFDENDKLQYKGVVYNEMKGAYSSPETWLSHEMQRVLFRGSCYDKESGGAPDAIPRLSYEDFTAFHREHYHPGNAWFSLYGDFNLEERLAQIENDYLNHFPARAASPAAHVPPERELPTRSECTYPVNDAVAEKEQTFIALNFDTGCATDPVHALEMSVLEHVLVGSAAAPLRKALQESGLGRDTLDWGFGNDTARTTFAFGIKDSEPERAEAFEKLAFSVLHHLATDGIPQRLIDAAVNTVEFNLREANFGGYPKGVVYALGSLASWIHGGDPFESLRFEKHLGELKTQIAGGRLEKLIREVLLDNPRRALVICKPSLAAHEEGEKRVAAELAAAQAAMSPQRQAEVREKQRLLLELQRTPDSPEALALIPQLSRSDLKRQVDPIPGEWRDIAGVKTFFHPIPEAVGIGYAQLTLDASSVGADDIGLFALLSSVSGRCGAGDMDFATMAEEIGIHTGGLALGMSMSTTQADHKVIDRRLTWDGKVMSSHAAHYARILSDFLLRLELNDQRRVREILVQAQSRLKSHFQSNGSAVARSLLAAQLSPVSWASEQAHGFPFLALLEKSIADIDGGGFEALRQRLLGLHRKLLRRGHITLNLTCRPEDWSLFADAFAPLFAAIPAGAEVEVPFVTELKPEKIGIATSGKVQYVASGVNLAAAGFVPTGSFELLHQSLSTGYLWDKVRVQGGAYGCHLSHDRLSGVLSICSYRDPALRETLQVYTGLAEHLEKLELSDRELDKLLIGTFGRLDSPLTPAQKGRVAFARFVAGISHDDVQRRRDELFAATLSDLRAYASCFRLLAEQGSLVVHGSEAKVQANKDLFDRIQKVCGGAGSDDDDDDDDDDGEGCDE